MVRKWILLAFLGSFFTACEKEAVLADANIDPDLLPYFELFEAEAAERGLNVNLAANNIEGFIENIPGRGVVGQCAYSADSPHTVTIDLPFWNTASDILREYIVFHELGHCYLERGHLDAADANGNCLSIMESGLGDCDPNYTDNTREAYLDELFSH